MSFTLATLKTAIQDYLECTESTFVTNLPTFIKEAESTIPQSIKKEPTKKEAAQKIPARSNGADIDPVETQEWLNSLSAVISKDGSDRAHYLLKKLIDETYREGINKQ